jgi:UDP-N-acetylmuramyl pentapeptide phosphotransferase/UDP-N-acetylglucosamine-1-phosphate transferase
MPFLALLAAIGVAAAVFSAIATRALIPLLTQAGIVARPNARSLHSEPTPLGGGAAPVAAIAIAWIALALAGRLGGGELLVLLGAALLAAVSWFDDKAGVTAGGRLVVQILVVALTLALHPFPGPVFQSWLPPLAEHAATALIWVWFVNLFNFMDGADGLAASEAVAIGAGLVLVTAFGAARDPATAASAAAVAGAAFGFLVWNWAPARIFMGDVGSIPLGYLLGFLLLRLASEGRWKAALILPLYFLADATITLARRALRGEKVWRAHRQHFYQRAVLDGLGHAATVGRIIVANLALIACAWAAENGFGWAALAAAAGVVAILLVVLARARYTGAR